MKLRVLGCSGAEFPGHSPSGFLVDEGLLLDAGTVGSALEQEEQGRIRNILVTHSHLDHIRSIPLLADNIVVSGASQRVEVIGTAEVLGAIASHLMNGLIWPDFTKIPSPQVPVLTYREIRPEEPFTVGTYRVTASRVNHPVPAVGYRITRDDTSILYTGDTGPTDRIWQTAGELDALIIEVSFPSSMEELALMTGHLTPPLLAGELAKLSRPPRRVLITHLKPQYQEIIMEELQALSIPGLELLQDGGIYEF